MTLLAMTPHDWQSAAQIEERIDWSRLRACAGRKWLNAPGKRTDVLRRTVLEDRFRRQGLVEREGIGRGRMPDGTFHNGSLVYRLTERGRELKTKLERGETPLRGPPVAQVAFPVGWVPAHRKILCTLVPGAWRAAREIWEAAMPGCTRTEGDNLVTNFAPKLRRAGFIERKENPVGRDLTYLPWTEEYRRNRATPRWFYRLTERGVELRKALLLID